MNENIAYTRGKRRIPVTIPHYQPGPQEYCTQADTNTGPVTLPEGKQAEEEKE